MKRMATSNVLVVGLRGLGVEIGKPIFQDLTLSPAYMMFSQKSMPRWRQDRGSL